jgi:CubicO group peptidase (beta-lactamase class C family)
MKMKKLIFIVALFVYAPAVLLYGQAPEKVIAGVSVDRLMRYENFIKKEIETGKLAGAVFLVQRKGEMVYQNTLGFTKKADKTPMKSDNLFFIQSMTKPIITTAFMMLYEEGHFLLNDPVSKYLPEFKDLKVSKDVSTGKSGETVPLKREITIAHILSHTAGFSHGLGQSQLDKDVLMEQYGKPHATVGERVKNLTTLPLVGQPGEQWYYSAAPDVLSALIEKFSGMSTDKFLQERLFKPLGMNDTWYNIPKQSQPRATSVYSVGERSSLGGNGNAEPYRMEGNTLWSGVNGLFSTASDYMKFCQMLLNGGEYNANKVLSRKTIELMTKNQVGNLFPAPGVGFGFGFAVVTNVADNKLYGSEGTFYWSGAFNTHFFIDPKEQLAAVFMTQLDPYNQYYHDKLRQFVYQAIVD